MKQIVILTFTLFISITIYAQSHFWAQNIYSSSNAITNSISIDSNHNSYVIGNYRDTLKIEKIILISKSYLDETFIAKFNVDGKLKWCNTIYPIGKSKANLLIYNIRTISSNKILIYGYSNYEIIKLSLKDSITNTMGNGKGFIVIYDSSGNLIEKRTLYNCSSGLLPPTNGQLDIDNQNNIYITCAIGTGVIYSKGDSSIVSSTTGVKYGIIKYSNGFDNILWHKEISDMNVNYFNIMKIRIGHDNNLYIASLLKSGNQVINKIKYSVLLKYHKAFLVILSPKGDFIHAGYLNSDITQQDNIHDVAAIDTNRIYVLGYVQDSIFNNGKWYHSANRKSNGTSFPYVGLISTSKSAKWIKLSVDKDMGSPIFTGTWYQGKLNFDNVGNIYSSFRQYGSKFISIGGLSDTNIHNSAFVKFDSLGNALWLRSSAIITDMQPDDKNVIYGGSYSGSLTLKPFTLKSSSYSAFAAKTQDYAINRGKLFAGPYCAGDTILVPYDKNGDFDTSNFFIAELSDENGNFDGRERELGRLKTNTDSVVIGKLPLFQTVSSGKYRIRIRSTNPVVQSFYQYDILRLLIYSKDKANPGPTETICYGDSFTLNTYGGTAWTWSPKYNMEDSTQRQTMVWPRITTIYKIIIGDSSGCGAPDTTYKKIIVRKPLKAILAFNDTVVCDGSQIKIPSLFMGGDSLNYQWQWYLVNPDNSWALVSSGKFKVSDTLLFSPKVNANDTLKVALVLKDDCTENSDIAFLTVSQKKPVFIAGKFKDTTVCYGKSVIWKAKATGGTPGKYQWQWLDLNNNKILSSTDSLNYIAQKTTRIKLIVNDGCPALGDYSIFTIIVKAQLKLTTNLKDTSLCFGENLNLNAIGNGGDDKAYNHTWILDKKVISTTDNVFLKTEDQFSINGETKKLILVLNDNCSFPNDSVIKTIIVKPSPKAGFNYDLACHRTITNFTFTGSKPQSPINTSFNWNLNNEANSNIENPSKLFSTTGTKKINLKVSSSNGCIDTLTKDIDVQFQSTADFSANDVCETDSVAFINKSLDATGYKWRFGDGQISNSKDPKHKYQIASSTTFNVSLVAVVTGGCSDSIVKAVTINENPKSDFTYSQGANGKVDFKANQASAISYRWLFGNGDSTKVATQNCSYTYSKSSLYNVCLKVVNTAGCLSQTCKQLSITGGVSSLDKHSGFKIYPNPNEGIFTLEIETPLKDISIEVYDVLGNLVRIVDSQPSQKQYSIDLKVADGIYLIKVKNGESEFNQKIIVHK